MFFDRILQKSIKMGGYLINFPFLLKKTEKKFGVTRKCSIFGNYSAPPMGMSNRLTVVLQQELH